MRLFNRWLWKRSNHNGYHKLKIYYTPFGVYWIIRWGYWMAGFCQFFSMGKLYIRIHKRFKI